MGRPLKTGLDYFPIDVTLDDPVELLEAECGLEGFAILIKLWQKIYSNGYYIEWSDDNAMLFARKINSGINKVNSVVNASFRRNLFSKSLHEKYGILTSAGIQKRYFKACADCKRKNIPAISQYLLLAPEETKLITEFIELTQEESTQKKGKEKRLEENKEDHTTKDSSSAVPTDKPLKFANDRSSIQFQLAGHLAKRMRDNNPECKLPKEQSKQLDDWCIEIDRMIRIDGREPEQIREVIDWCQDDDFWKSNILCPKSLRKQYDKLVVRMKKPATKIDRMKQNALRPEIQAWLSKED